MLRSAAVYVVSGGLLLTGCQQGIPRDALMLQEVQLDLRNRQTRYFNTQNEEQVLAASAGVLQDLGFTLDESETEVGLITASKDRDATEAGQIAGAVVLAVLFGAYTATDKNQKIRVSLVTKPYGDLATQTAVRVTFQRIVWNTQNQVSKTEQLDDPVLYQEFFDKLSQSLFLSAHEV